MDVTERFTGKAALYAAVRPSYAPELRPYFAARGLGAASAVADVGAGTGIFSAFLLPLGCTVYGVEPNADMRAAWSRTLDGEPRAHLVCGTADATGLPDGSMDAVTAAQAFHWFDAAAFGAECRRILKPGGEVHLIWNHRDTESALVKENAALCREFCPGFHGFSSGIGDEPAHIAAFFAHYTETVFPNDLTYDEDAFVGRNLSSSYAPGPDAPQYAAFSAALRTLFRKYAVDGRIELPNHTYVYSGAV